MEFLTDLGRVAEGFVGMMVLFAFYAILLPLGVMYVVLIICRFIPMTGRHKSRDNG